MFVFLTKCHRRMQQVTAGLLVGQAPKIPPGEPNAGVQGLLERWLAWYEKVRKM